MKIVEKMILAFIFTIKVHCGWISDCFSCLSPSQDSTSIDIETLCPTAKDSGEKSNTDEKLDSSAQSYNIYANPIPSTSGMENQSSGYQEVGSNTLYPYPDPDDSD